MRWKLEQCTRDEHVSWRVEGNFSFEPERMWCSHVMECGSCISLVSYQLAVWMLFLHIVCMKLKVKVFCPSSNNILTLTMLLKIIFHSTETSHCSWQCLIFVNLHECQKAAKCNKSSIQIIDMSYNIRATSNLCLTEYSIPIKIWCLPTLVGRVGLGGQRELSIQGPHAWRVSCS